MLIGAGRSTHRVVLRSRGVRMESRCHSSAFFSCRRRSALTTPALRCAATPAAASSNFSASSALSFSCTHDYAHYEFTSTGAKIDDNHDTIIAAHIPVLRTRHVKQRLLFFPIAPCLCITSTSQ
jgi:hypothetical protein